MNEEAEIRGVIYAVDDSHRQCYVERSDGAGRVIVQPEVFVAHTLAALLDTRCEVAVRGRWAAGVPLLYRAQVRALGQEARRGEE